MELVGEAPKWELKKAGFAFSFTPEELFDPGQVTQSLYVLLI